MELQVLPFDLGLAAQGTDVRQLHQFFAGLRGNLFCPHAKCAVRNLEPPHPRIGRDNRHLVEGQGARLIQTDGLHTAEGFYRVKPADEHMMPTHVEDTQGQSGRGDRGQSFRNRGHGKRDGTLEHLQQAIALQDPNAEHERTHTAGEIDELGAHLI